MSRRSVRFCVVMALPLAALIVVALAASGRFSGRQRPRVPGELPLRQPGNPWVDDPKAYNADPDFETHAVRLRPRDGFQVLDYPPFVTAAEADARRLVAGEQPVLGVAWKDQAKAYPILVLGLHEISNDAIAEEPIVSNY